MTEFTEWRSLVDGQRISAIPDSAIHQWRFDEGSGTTANDDIGDLDGSISGSTFVSDNNGVGEFVLDFDGTDDHVDYEEVPSEIQGSNTEFSIAITAEDLDSITVDGSNRPIIWSWDSRSTLAFEGGDLVWYVDDQTGVGISQNDIPSGRVRVCATHDNGSHNLYINGSDDNLFSSGVAPDTTGGNMRIGALQDRVDSEFHYEGILDNPIIYDKELTQQEVDDDLARQPWS